MNRTEDEPTLYERIGGRATVESLIGEFYGRVLRDAELEPFFRDTEMGKLRRMQHAFFSAALGGEVEYPGRPLAHVHHGRGITPHHLQRFLAHLQDSLAGVDLSSRERAEIIDRINTYADEIVGGGGLDG